MRIRTVKPEFWQNEKLGQLPREVRMLGAALLNWADDEGYFKSHPALIAGSLLPYDSDGQRFVAKALPQLEAIGYVELDQASGIGRIPKLVAHQRINRPSKSRLAEVVGQDRGLSTFTEPLVSPHGVLSEPSPTEGNREQGNGTGSGERGNGTGRPQEVAAATAAAETPEDLQRAWNDLTAPPLPRCAELGKARKSAATAALKRRPLAQWREVFERINASAFCRGGSGEWLADFDWAVRAEGKKPEPAAKVLEGSYDRHATGPPGQVVDLRRPVAAQASAFDDPRNLVNTGEF